MTSPTPLHVRNADTVLPPATSDYSVSHIYGQLIEPERGRVSPLFLEYQDENARVEGSDNQVAEGAARTSKTSDEVPVRIPSTSDIAEVRISPEHHLAPNLPSEYIHDEYDGQFHFVPSGHADQVHKQVAREAAVATVSEAEYAPLTSYAIFDDDSDKENRDPNQEDYEDAEEVPREREDAQRMGPRRRGRRGGRGRRGVADAEEGPIRLYHPWNQKSVGVQGSEAPIPDGYERNNKHNYIPFPIVNDNGRAVPAKYVAVFMAANPYALGKLTHDGPAHTGEIHAAPRFDYKEPGSVQDLKE